MVQFQQLESASKCHLFISPYQPVPVNIKGSIIESSNCEKLLGIYIDTVTSDLNTILIEFVTKQVRNFIIV